jgi:hypothetical protein
MHAPISKSETQRLQARLREQATALHDLREENARLRAGLAASMLPYKGHTIKIIDGVATVFLHGGGVYERVQRVIDRPGEAGYEWHWRKLEAIPTSPAERIDAVAPALTEMAVVGDAMERAS